VTRQGADEELYAHVAEYRDYPGYSEQERLAVEFAERFVTDHLGMDDAFFARLKTAFADDEILDLAICVAAFLGLGRLLRVLGVDPVIQVESDAESRVSSP
jgi:alkylhydroperoxidase family enzyme